MAQAMGIGKGNSQAIDANFLSVIGKILVTSELGELSGGGSALEKRPHEHALAGFRLGGRQ
jgi:hypothetical protein